MTTTDGRIRQALAEIEIARDDLIDRDPFGDVGRHLDAAEEYLGQARAALYHPVEQERPGSGPVGSSERRAGTDEGPGAIVGRGGIMAPLSADYVPVGWVRLPDGGLSDAPLHLSWCDGP